MPLPNSTSSSSFLVPSDRDDVLAAYAVSNSLHNNDESDEHRSHRFYKEFRRRLKFKWKSLRADDRMAYERRRRAAATDSADPQRFMLRQRPSRPSCMSTLSNSLLFYLHTFRSLIVYYVYLFLGNVIRVFYICESWIICALVGMSTGLIYSFLDTMVRWLNDIREGYCVGNVYFNNEICCAISVRTFHFPSVQYDASGNQLVEKSFVTGGLDSSAVLAVCDDWRSWSSVIIQNGWASEGDDYVLAYAIYVILSIIFASIACWLVLSFAPYAAGGGAPEIKTILGGVVIKRVLGLWTLLIKTMGLPLSVGSGLSVGKEGPMCHIAACLGNVTCRYFPGYKANYTKTNEILSAACAAGVAVAFGAPIGGILYSLEEISSYFPQQTMWRAFFCALVASLTIQYVDPFQEGKLVQFEINYTNPWQWSEILLFALIGAIGGIVGTVFIKMNLFCQEFRRKSFIGNFPLMEVAVVAAFTAIIKFQSAYTRGNFNDILAALFSQCGANVEDPLMMCDTRYTEETLISLLILFFSALFLSIYSIGMKIPAGLLIPSLVIGASMGRFFGTLTRYWQHQNPSSSFFAYCTTDTNCITPGIYAIVGGASVLGGVTRMTICIAVIMFEITGGLSYLLPIMIGLVFSKLVGDWFGRHSIYEGAIAALRYPFLDVKDELPTHLIVRDALKSSPHDLLIIKQRGNTIASIYQLCDIASKLSIAGFPVVTNATDNFVVGYCTRVDLLTKLAKEIAKSHNAVDFNTEAVFGSVGGGRDRDRSREKERSVESKEEKERESVVSNASNVPIVPSFSNSPPIDLSSCLHTQPVQVVDSMPLHRLHDMFSKMGLRYCLVVRFGKLIGIVTKKDILNTIADYREATGGHS